MTSAFQPPKLVIPVDIRAAERHGSMDLYLPPDLAAPAPLVVVVHGGPVPAAVRPVPRDWPMYQGYASLIAARGAVAAVASHRLHSPADYAVAADDVLAAVDLARADGRVDDDRVAIWFFSGAGLLMADWLRKPPSWLRGIVATYPYLAPLTGWPTDERFRPVDAVGEAGALPVVLTRAGRELAEPAAAVAAFIAAASRHGTRLEVIDVPDGVHGFDATDDTDAARRAIGRAVDAVFELFD